MSDYRINNSPILPGAKCECGHTIAAHGSNGMVCAACGPKVCPVFKEAAK